MAVRLTDLVREQRTITVDFRGETLDVVYRPGAMTPDLGVAAVDDTEAPVAMLLSAILVRWDLFDDAVEEQAEPTRVPVDYDTLRSLSSEFLLAVQRAILADIFVSKNSGATSGDGSLPGVNSAKRRSGMR